MLQTPVSQMGEPHQNCSPLRVAATVAWCGGVAALLARQAKLAAIPALLLQRFSAAASRPPSAVSVVVPILAFSAVALPFGLHSGFLQRPDTSSLKVARLIPLGCVTLVAPSLAEEALFRVALLPSVASLGVAAAPVAVSWLSFVVYHVDCWHPPLHSDARFLATAGGLGAACTAAYIMSGGSLWAPVLVHWFPVWAWLGIFGGEDAHKRGSFAPRRLA